MSTLAADWGPFEQCRTCREYDWANRHRCAPVHYVRLAGKGEEWFTVHAVDPQAAAERACRFLDEYREHEIAYRGQCVTIEVAWDNPEEVPEIAVQRFAVEGELRPHYSGREVS